MFLLTHSEGEEMNMLPSLTELAACVVRWEAFYGKPFTELDLHVVFRA